MDEKSPRKRCVLIVDDNMELARAYEELLEEHGYDVLIASNGVTALKHIRSELIDAVVSDLKMPQLEGDLFYVTVERVKPSLCEQFIFMTGHAENERFRPFLNKAPVRVLHKPVSVQQLLQALDDLFGGR